MRSAVPQKLRLGNAARKSVMNALMSSRPRRGSCREYLSSMSGAVISSTTPRLTLLPQNSVNQRPITALLSSSLLMRMAPRDLSQGSPTPVDDLRTDLRVTRASQTPVLALQSKAEAARTFGAERPPTKGD